MCSKSCGGGQKECERYTTVAPKGNGTKCEELPGNKTTTQLCNNHKCPGISKTLSFFNFSSYKYAVLNQFSTFQFECLFFHKILQQL